jgi:ribonuclease HI
MNYKIYTDGACKKNPGKGGYAAVKYDEDNGYIFVSGYKAETTNNEMELYALYEALRNFLVSKEDSYDLYIDSSYVVGTITKWIYKWAIDGSINTRPNSQLLKWIYEELLRLEDNNIKYTVHKVRGHVGIEGNETADLLANKAIP